MACMIENVVCITVAVNAIYLDMLYCMALYGFHKWPIVGIDGATCRARVREHLLVCA